MRARANAAVGARAKAVPSGAPPWSRPHGPPRTKETYLAAQYRRLAARRGAKRAAVAVAHSLLIIVYMLLTEQQQGYHDLGSHYFDERDRQAVERRLVRRLEALGYSVSLEPTSPAA